MFCKNCGNELPDGTKFCGKCGASQKSTGKATKQLNDYLKVLNHIKDSNNHKKSSVDVEELEKNIYSILFGISYIIIFIVFIYMTIVNFSLKNIIKYIIEFFVIMCIDLIITMGVSKVICFFYPIINRLFNWEEKPIYIKVNQLQETACKKYTHMSIEGLEFVIKGLSKYNITFNRKKALEDLTALSKQMPFYTLEQLIDSYYLDLSKKFISARIESLNQELKTFRHSCEIEKSNYPTEIVERLSDCENSFEELINNKDNISDSEILKCIKRLENMFYEIRQEEKRFKDEQRRKNETEQRRRNFNRASYTDISLAEKALHQLQSESFYKEQIKKFDPVRLETDALIKSFYKVQEANKGKTGDSKFDEVLKKLLSVINHTIDAIRYDDDNLIAKLTEEREKYEKLLEETEHRRKEEERLRKKEEEERREKEAEQRRKQYEERRRRELEQRRDSGDSLDFVGVMAGALIANAMVHKCGNCSFYIGGRCRLKNKKVSPMMSSCSKFQR
ncbi:MAG: zinc-ribbon domain-containing protein [Ruminococcus flavefaciens]|nr:zinc-ribbon domain-containing protein [Ruminococcus flavefaciens]